MRECYTDDLLTFGADGSFSIDFQNFTWIENWQTGDSTSYCGNPADENVIGINPNGQFTYQVSLPSEDGLNGVTDAQLTLFGVGAYIGVPKAYNGGEIADPQGNINIDPNSIMQRTYTYRLFDENTMMVSMDIGGGYWTTILGRDGVEGTAGRRLALANDFSGNVNFGQSGIQFKPLVNAKAKFIDFDNDGLPELIYAGSTSSTSAGVAAVYVYYFDNMNGNLQAYELQLENEFPVLTGSSIAFGDVDNDQDYDLILAGSSPASGRVTDVYLNEGINANGQLIMKKDELNAGVITGVSNGTLDLVDFDNDGDLDLVVSGDSFNGDILQLYRNDEGVYTSISETLSGLAAMKNGRTSWGDFDGDGNADMLYSGEVLGKGEFTGLALYDQVTATYKEDAFDLSQFTNAAVAFGDYDGDDDLDMALTGVNKNYDESDPGSNKYISKLYVNVRNESALLDSACG